MKNKGIKIAALSLLLIGSIILCRRGKRLKTTTVTGKFTIETGTGETKETLVFWIEDGKYWSQSTASGNTSDKKEVSKSEYDKNYTTYLN